MGKDNHKQRPKINNFNPYNKLQLNKFHQIGAKAHASDSKLLHKKKRDLQRLIKHMKDSNKEVNQEKVAELEKVEAQLANNKKGFEKDMRKQFFIKGKYKQVMEIEMRKVVKKIRSLKETQGASNDEIVQWQKKQRYIKFYPKNLKYVSLFPSGKPLEEKAIQFQKKIMDDIEETYRKKLQKKNQYKSENAKKQTSSNKNDKKNKDNFFIEQQEDQEQE